MAVVQNPNSCLTVKLLQNMVFDFSKYKEGGSGISGTGEVTHAF